MGSDGRMENRLTPDWGDAKHVILYGCGNVARACLGKIQKDFSVDYIIDQMGEMARSWNGCKLLAPKQGLKQRTRQKIIVMTGGRVYQEIAFSLQMAGLKEYEDFCSIEYFFTCWYWTFREENVVMELHMALTMRCTLRCANCNMFVPYYERPVTFTLRQLEEEIELLFQFVDYLGCLTLLGGEPFLYEDFADFLMFLKASYAGRIGTIKVITNGTLLPEERLLDALAAAEVWVSISDYTQEVPYRKRLQALQSLLDKKSIQTTFTEMREWCDFGFPEHPLAFAPEKCQAHRIACSPIFHGYNDGKIFYCHVVWSAEKIGRYHLQAKDFIDLRALKREERHRISCHCLGDLDGGYVGLCQMCGGCGFDNKKLVSAGRQTKETAHRSMKQ